MAALGIVAAPLQQLLNQRIAISGQGGDAKRVAGLLQPAEHRGHAGGRIEAHAIGQAAVAGGVVGQHQGKPSLRRRCLPQRTPIGQQLRHPAQPLCIRGVALQCGGQAGIGAAHLLEGAHTGGDAPIQFRQGNLQAEIQGRQPEAAELPAGPALGAAEQLEHRHRKLLPQGGPQARLLQLHRGEGGGAQHSLHTFQRQ